MNESIHHTVTTISWDSRFDDKGLAPRLQDRLGDWSRNRMIAEISAVFDKLCPPDQIWRIPSLEIDLGMMDWTNLERNLEERFQRGLTKALQDLLLYAGIGDKKIEILEGIGAQVEAIKHYLIHGYLPWNHEGLSGSINALMANQFQVNPGGLGSMLARVGQQHEDVRKRMAWQLEEPNILGIIRVLEPDHHLQITDLSAELSTIQEKESIVQANQADFKRNLWLWVLTYLYTDRGTLFNRVAFMKHNILHMARHYHLAFESLFTMIEAAVEAVGKKRKITADFLLAIQAIGREIKFIKGESAATTDAAVTTGSATGSAVTMGSTASAALPATALKVTDLSLVENIWTHILDLASTKESTFHAFLQAVGADHTEAPIEGLLLLKEQLAGPHAADSWCALLGADYPASVRTDQTMNVLVTLIDQVCEDRPRIVYQLIRNLYKGIKEGGTQRIFQTQRALQILLLRTSPDIWNAFPEKDQLQEVWPYIAIPSLDAHLGGHARGLHDPALQGAVHGSHGMALHDPAQQDRPQALQDFAKAQPALNEQCLSLLEVAKRSGQWTAFTNAIIRHGYVPQELQWMDRMYGETEGHIDGRAGGYTGRGGGGNAYGGAGGYTGLGDGGTTGRGDAGCGPRANAGGLIRAWLSAAPSDFIGCVGSKSLPKRQMEWLASLISFKELTGAIGQTERGLKPMLKSLEAFYQGLGQCAIGPVSAKEFQGILFWKVMKAWSTKNWRAMTPVFLWNNLVWDLCMKRGLNRKEVEHYFHLKSTHFPYPIAAPTAKPSKEKLDIKLPAKGNIKDIVEVKNAGLVLLNAYMLMMFERLGLCKDKQWLGEPQAMEGVHYLQFLVTGHSHTAEHLLPLNKLLCGLPLAHPVAEGVTISDNHKTLMEGLIKAAIGYWPVIGACTLEGFRGNWLVRNGLLSESEERWALKVEKRPYDLLIDKSPFTFSIIRLPWMRKPLHVKWT